ncbi:MAG TPA: ABC transporter substrate-binding protein [Gemmatimonadales bacterium]|nr:ABC transporter substrate-binding protein [Gemmatimonadales bacterium]
MIPARPLLSPARRGAVLLAIALSGCAPSPRPAVGPAEPAPGDAACQIVSGPEVRRESLLVAVTEPVDPVHAPVPRNAAERLVFAQLYETLVQVDCGGRVGPALARSWMADRAGRRWTFTLREDARFWDGAPVTARDVVASWASRDTTAVASVAAVDERTVNALLTRPAETLPPLFADPALAVRKSAPDRGWPIGTGAFWVGAATASAEAVRAAPLGAGLPVIVFRVVPERDQRDLLDEPVDVLVTDDAAALDYAGTREQLVSAALPWERTYVLIAPARIGAAPPALNPATIAREGLWRAVRGDARTAAPPYWWEDSPGCPRIDRAGQPPRPAPIRRRVTYARGDPTAQELADRLVALGAVGSGVVAAGLSPREFSTALQAGSEWAYVVALPRRVLDPCRMMRQSLPSTYAASLVPLVDTRSHAIVRRGVVRLGVGLDGTLRFAPP